MHGEKAEQQAKLFEKHQSCTEECLRMAYEAAYRHVELLQNPEQSLYMQCNGGVWG